MGEIKASFADKRIVKSFIPVLGLLLWQFSAFWGFIIFDDLIFVIISSILISIACLIPATAALIVYSVLSSKKELTVSENGINGKMFNGKTVSLSADMVNFVEAHGINGIKIADKSGMLYKFSAIDNRDFICLAMSDLGIAVNPNLVKDKNAVIVSEPDVKKKKVMPTVSLILAIVSNIFLSATSLWFNSDGNYYSYYDTYYSYYTGNFVNEWHSGYNYYPDEMFTLYLCILFLIAAIAVLAVYIPKINHRLSVSEEKVRGVNGFGKITVTPIVQITGAFSKNSDAAVIINCSGVKKKYCMLANHMQIVQTINGFRPNVFVPVTGHVAQPYVQPVGSVQPAYVPQTQPTPPANSTTDVADEIKKLKELLDLGAITQEEFDAKKKQVLGL